VGKSYGKGVSLRPLIEAMDRIPAPAAVSGLVWPDKMDVPNTRHQGRYL